MCPVCLASIGVVLAKAASAGAVTAIVIQKLRKAKVAGAATSTGGRAGPAR
ncbi:hypothetical protein [Sorangium sp. So ce861]|uniref:hypothetical protein n=1 Tax=Sorangium sp. So ce861 TaxID=3133323 RepID=UPI003F5FCADE